ncbi:hypothetical protein J2S55_008559 [Streptosporangium brasiliense]|uniref:Uncharacterized protein n=1 Tax=Streptosporangium brasiliense TaxID=47480 RepID=A0ABT9RJ13_9ACTN|nr:hypothetical protein [Streptosporangium brasiliense]
MAGGLGEVEVPLRLIMGKTRRKNAVPAGVEAEM